METAPTYLERNVHGQMSLVAYSPERCKESGMTGYLNTAPSTACMEKERGLSRMITEECFSITRSSLVCNKKRGQPVLIR